MHIKKTYALPLLMIFVFVAMFGMYVMFASADHHSDCPLMPSAVACATSLSGHIDHWKLAFANMVELLIIATFLFWPGSAFAIVRDPAHIRLDFQDTVSSRPTLFQELFSHGIHNRKEPHLVLISIT